MVLVLILALSHRTSGAFSWKLGKRFAERAWCRTGINLTCEDAGYWIKGPDAGLDRAVGQSCPR